MISARQRPPPWPYLLISSRRIALGFSLASCFSNVAAAGTVSADPSHGATLARQWCASCNVVTPDQVGTIAEAPPFATIARRPDFDVGKLALFLLDPHPKMPDMALTRAEAADLSAYIATLRQ